VRLQRDAKWIRARINQRQGRGCEAANLNIHRKCGVDSGSHGSLNLAPSSRVELCAAAGPSQLGGWYLESYLTPPYSASGEKAAPRGVFPPPSCACCTLVPAPRDAVTNAPDPDPGGGPGTGGGPGAHGQYFFFAGGGPGAHGLDNHDQSMYTTLFVVRPTLRFTILPHLSFLLDSVFSNLSCIILPSVPPPILFYIWWRIRRPFF
jgi:hypothetical protein